MLSLLVAVLVVVVLLPDPWWRFNHCTKYTDGTGSFWICIHARKEIMGTFTDNFRVKYYIFEPLPHDTL